MKHNINLSISMSVCERIHFKVMSLTYNALQSSQPTYLRELFTIQPTRSTRSSSCLTFLEPRSLLISCSPTEPYPSLHHVFGMTYHLNSAPFLYLHHRHCQSQDIIFIRLLFPSPPGRAYFNVQLIAICAVVKSKFAV